MQCERQNARKRNKFSGSGAHYALQFRRHCLTAACEHAADSREPRGLRRPIRDVGYVSYQHPTAGTYRTVCTPSPSITARRRQSLGTIRLGGSDRGCVHHAAAKTSSDCSTTSATARATSAGVNSVAFSTLLARRNTCGSSTAKCVCV